MVLRNEEIIEKLNDSILEDLKRNALLETNFCCKCMAHLDSCKELYVVKYVAGGCTDLCSKCLKDARYPMASLSVVRWISMGDFDIYTFFCREDVKLDVKRELIHKLEGL